MLQAYDLVDQLAQHTRSEVNHFIFEFHRVLRPVQLVR